MPNLRRDRPVPEGFTRYTGDYDKHFYDVLLYSGQVIRDCWPNAGTFHSRNTGTVFDGKRVFALKPVDDPYFRTDGTPA